MAVSAPALRANRKRNLTSEGEARLSKMRFLAPSGALSLLMAVDCIYVLAFGFSKGLDSTAPDFGRYWYTVLAFNMFVLMPSVTATILGIWLRPCKTCKAQQAAGGVDPEHELQHHWIFMGILLTGALSVLGQLAIAIGGDAAWHQSSLRDTSVTPIHILGFYGFAPLFFLAIIASFAYARTRLPEVFGAHRGLSVGYLLFVAGALFGMVNFTFNEFGHSMWIYEELFTYPMHWPFVAFISTNAAIFALAVPSLMRVAHILGTGEPAAADATLASAVR